MKRKILWTIFSVTMAIIAIVFVCDLLVTQNAKGRIYDDVGAIQHRNVGLVLGTSPVSKWTGRRNQYFDCRIEAAASLVKAGKVDTLIVSGGDYRKPGDYGYDEPIAMRDSLIALGVDSAIIVLDYDGTRTLNSIAKIKKVYCSDSIVIISQQYHNERALYQADYLGVDAVAFNARTPRHQSTWFRNRCREYISRVKLFIDIIVGIAPDF